MYPVSLLIHFLLYALAVGMQDKNGTFNFDEFTAMISE
jgi:hypothetical protein